MKNVILVPQRIASSRSSSSGGVRCNFQVGWPATKPPARNGYKNITSKLADARDGFPFSSSQLRTLSDSDFLVVAKFTCFTGCLKFFSSSSSSSSCGTRGNGGAWATSYGHDEVNLRYLRRLFTFAGSAPSPDKRLQTSSAEFAEMRGWCLSNCLSVCLVVVTDGRKTPRGENMNLNVKRGEGGAESKDTRGTFTSPRTATTPSLEGFCCFVVFGALAEQLPLNSVTSPLVCATMIMMVHSLGQQKTRDSGHWL